MIYEVTQSYEGKINLQNQYTNKKRAAIKFLRMAMGPGDPYPADEAPIDHITDGLQIEKMGYIYEFKHRPLTSFKYANLHMHTDVVPYEVVRVVSDFCIEIRKLEAAIANDWKPDQDVGGFAAHTVNNYEQEYTYSQNKNNPIIKMRLNRKNGPVPFWKSKMGKHKLNDQAIKFYDYNF